MQTTNQDRLKGCGCATFVLLICCIGLACMCRPAKLRTEVSPEPLSKPAEVVLEETITTLIHKKLAPKQATLSGWACHQQADGTWTATMTVAVNDTQAAWWFKCRLHPEPELIDMAILPLSE